MRALFAKGAAQSSVLRKLDARTKLTVTAATALLTVASSGMLAQLVIFAVTLVYVLLLKRPGLVAVLYALMAAMMAIAALSDSFSARPFHDERGDGACSHHACRRPAFDAGTDETSVLHFFAYSRDAAFYSDLCQRHQTGLGNASHQGLAVGACNAYVASDFVGTFDFGTDSFPCVEKLGDLGGGG